jgi:hypothetical protein
LTKQLQVLNIFLAPLDLEVRFHYILPKFFSLEFRNGKMKLLKVNPFAKIILSLITKMRFKPKAFSFDRTVKESQRVLICMPTDLDRFAMAGDMLSTFVDIFPGKRIFVLLPFLEAKGYLSDGTSYRVIYAQESDLNVFSLPGKKFIRKLSEYKFDISLDLDLEEGFFNRYLCLKCGIPLRIGPSNRKAFPLYNIQLSVLKDRLDSRELYEGMVETLKALFSGRGQTASNPV